MAALRAILLAVLGCVLAGGAMAGDRYFFSSDGVRLHYFEAGRGHTLVLVPGWTMPAWIWDEQIRHFSPAYHVVAFDPRAQGASAVAPSGYEPFRRGRDIAELIATLGGDPVLLVGWSLGVLDALAYVHEYGDGRLAGLVLVDNSVGEDPPPAAAPTAPRERHWHRPATRALAMRAFVAGMFEHPQPRTFLDRLTASSLRTPPEAAAELLAYPVPRSFWKEAVYAVHRPVLYVVTPRLAGQAANLAAHHPEAESVVERGVGHALFVDDPARFDALLDAFLRRRVWP
jgi:microsomal epoxide hydrolase